MRVPVFVLAVVLPLLAGCGPRHEVYSVGANIYQTTVSSDRGGFDEAQRMALATANSECAGRGMDAELVDIQGGHSPAPEGAATVTFRCVPRVR